MTDAREEDRALAAEYAMGLLPPAAAAEVEARMAREPELRAEVLRWTEDLVNLVDGVPDRPPSPEVKLRINRALFPEESQSLWRRLGILPALLGAAAAALVAVLVTQGAWLRPVPPDAVAELSAGDGAPPVLAAVTAEVLTVMTPEGLAPAGQVLELWLIADEAGPVSLGLLSAAGETELKLPPAQLAVLAGATLAISVEPPGGSPTGQPTGPVIAAGAFPVF